MTVLGGDFYDTVPVSDYAPIFGMQFETEIPTNTHIYSGLVIGGTFGMNHAHARLTRTIPAVYVRTALLHKIEVSLQLGYPYDDGFPFVKIGSVLGRWKVRTHFARGDWNRTRYRPGMIFGAAVDFQAGRHWLWGASVEYERYKVMKGNASNPGGGFAFSDWNARHAVTNAFLSLKRKF